MLSNPLDNLASGALFGLLALFGIDTGTDLLDRTDDTVVQVERLDEAMLATIDGTATPEQTALISQTRTGLEAAVDYLAAHPDLDTETPLTEGSVAYAEYLASQTIEGAGEPSLD